MQLYGCLTFAFLVGCVDVVQETNDDTGTPSPVDDIGRRGIDGCNCAGAAPLMRAPDNVAYPFQSVAGYYYRNLEAYWTEVDGEEVLATWLPPHIEQTSEAFVAWQAKSLQILAEREELGFAHRYYRGIFGFLDADNTGVLEQTCRPALDERARRLALLAHIGLSQAGECGENDDGTTKFWQVNGISMLEIGDVIDAYSLIPSGLATAVQVAPASRCILALGDHPPPPSDPFASPHDALVPCQVAFNASAVTEGVVLPVPSSAAVAGVALGIRGFTAAGTVALPNGLDEVRAILRDEQLRVMFAVGLPEFRHEPSRGPTMVRLVGHRVGPARNPNSLGVLLPDEHAWVDQMVGRHEEQCCRVECSAKRATSQAVADSACELRCLDEGVCATTSVSDGLVVMLSAVSNKECFGSCPEPARGAPDSAPTCGGDPL